MAGMTTRWGALRMFGLAAKAALRPGGPSIAMRLSAIPRMVRATLRGEYGGATLGTLGLMGLAAAYVVSPADLVPEAFFGLFGLADDAVVVTWLAAAIVASTEDFLAWESGQTPAATAAGRPGATPQDAPASAPCATETVRSFVVS